MAANTFLAIGTDANVGANWSLGTVPTNADQVKFDAASGNCILSANFVCDDIDSTGYTNTFTQLTFEIHCDGSGGAMLWAAGIFAGGSGLIKIDGDWSQTGGTFTNTSGIMEFTKSSNSFMTRTAGTYNHNNGTLHGTGNHFDLDMNGQDVFDCHEDFSNTATIWQFKSQTVIRGGMIQDRGTFANDDITIDLHGDFKVGNTQQQTGSVRFNMVGTGDQDIYFDKAGGVGKTGAGILVNKPSGTLTFFDDVEMIINNGSTILQYVAGTVVFDSTNILGDGGFKAIVDWFGGPRIPHYRVDKANSNTGITLASNLEVGLFTNLGMGPLDGAFTLDISGNVESDNSITGSANIELTGVNQTLNCVDSFGGATFTINSTGIISLLQNFQNTVSGSDFVMNAGTLDLKGFNFTISDQLIHTGGLINDTVGTGVFNLGRHVATAGTITLNVVFSITTTSGVIFSDSAGYTLNIGTYWFQGANHWDVQQLNTEFDNMVIDKCSTCNYSGTQVVDGNLTLTAMQNFLSGSTTTLRGNLTGSDGSGVGDFIFNGINNQSVDYSGTLPDVEVNKAGGVLTFVSNIRIEAGYQVTAGSVDWTTNSTLVEFVGGNNTFSIKTNSQPFNDLSFEKAGSSKYTLLDIVFVNDSFNIDPTATSLELSGFEIQIQGNVLVTESSLLGSTIIKFTGVRDQIFINALTDWFDSDIVVDKSAGQVRLGFVLNITKNLDVQNGVFCTNEFDCTINDLTVPVSARFNKTANSTVTVNGTLTGIITDVEDCSQGSPAFLVTL